MPMQLEVFSNNKVQPAAFPELARMQAALFGVSLTLAAGTTIAKKTSDGKMYAYAEPDDVQTVTINGTLSGGTYRLGFLDNAGAVQWTTGIAYNANTAAIQAAVDTCLGSSKCTVAGTAVSASTFTFGGTGYTKVKQELIRLDASALTGATNSSVAHTATYDGTDVAVGWLPYDIKTDASGNCYYSDSSAVASVVNHPRPSAEYYVAGVFDTATLTGYDAAALKDLGGRVGGDGLIYVL